MFTPAMQSGTFTVDVATSDNGGHPPEVEQVILHYMKRAIQCDRSTVSHLVTEAGQPQLAELIRRRYHEFHG